MASTLLTLVCKDCSAPFGIAVLPDVEHMRTIVPRALRSLIPDDLDLSGLTDQPVLCSHCAGKRGVEPFTNGEYDGRGRREVEGEREAEGGEAVAP